MDDLTPSNVDALPELEAPAVAQGAPVLDLPGLGDIPFRVEVPLGTAAYDLRSFLELQVGSVLQTDRQTGEPLEITVNGTPIARGEVRIHGEFFAIRVTEILGAPPAGDVEGAAPDVETPTSRT